MGSNSSSKLKHMVYASMFGALTAVGSFMVIPLQPVPITLQSMFTSLAGILLGAYAAAWSQIIYVLLGVIGLPVFAGGKAGLGTLLGPTGGYLLGFVAAACLIGKLADARREAGLAWLLLAVAAGDAVIYLLGTLQLVLVADLSWLEAVMAGVVPFIPGDLIKLVAAAWLGLKLRRYVSL